VEKDELIKTAQDLLEVHETCHVYVH